MERNLSMDTSIFLSLYQKNTFGLVQIQSICRRQFECGHNNRMPFSLVCENIAGKGQNAD